LLFLKPNFIIDLVGIILLFQCQQNTSTNNGISQESVIVIGKYLVTTNSTGMGIVN